MAYNKTGNASLSRLYLLILLVYLFSMEKDGEKAPAQAKRATRENKKKKKKKIFRIRRKNKVERIRCVFPPKIIWCLKNATKMRDKFLWRLKAQKAQKALKTPERPPLPLSQTPLHYGSISPSMDKNAHKPPLTTLRTAVNLLTALGATCILPLPAFPPLTMRPSHLSSLHWMQ